ncbi:MAG TPA: hypothetical protein P5571_12315 [Candidatus Krumholzibacteria bacterium]|nr:hypothetical protein [Candidatus Krumholzibacteria bacterium]HRX52144.1 hypothetical protein [Candidatus Krumholzibacteria bacterium]
MLRICGTLLLACALAGAAAAEIRPLDTDVALSWERLGFLDADVSDTYGHADLLGLEIAVPLAPAAQFLMGVAYGTMDGDPHYDDPTFTSGRVDATLIPLTLGFRTDISHVRNLRYLFDLSYQATWVEEGQDDADSGFCHGLVFGMGPELLLDDGRWGLGLNARWRGGSGDLGRGYQRHVFNTTGFSLRLSLHRLLGHGPEGGRP